MLNEICETRTTFIIAHTTLSVILIMACSNASSDGESVFIVQGHFIQEA